MGLNAWLMVMTTKVRTVYCIGILFNSLTYNKSWKVFYVHTHYEIIVMMSISKNAMVI